MTADPDDETGGSISGGPIDFDRLAVIRERFATDDRFTEVDDQPGFAPERLVCQYNRQLYRYARQSASGLLYDPEGECRHKHLINLVSRTNSQSEHPQRRIKDLHPMLAEVINGNAAPLKTRCWL